MLVPAYWYSTQNFPNESNTTDKYLWFACKRFDSSDYVMLVWSLALEWTEVYYELSFLSSFCPLWWLASYLLLKHNEPMTPVQGLPFFRIFRLCFSWGFTKLKRNVHWINHGGG